MRSVQQFPCGLPGTPGNVPKTWGGQIGDSPGLDAAGVLATAVLEMQLQSCGGVIRVFPAWPMGWQSEFTLAAEGGFLVSSRVTTNGEIPEVRIHSRLSGVCTVVNPWTEPVRLSDRGISRTFETTRGITFKTRAGQDYFPRPLSDQPALAVMHSECNVGPKWPFHQGLGDTVEAHLKRSDFFGMLGIAKDGLNPTRNKVQKALADQQAKATAKK